jgi:hypothetical protein
MNDASFSVELCLSVEASRMPITLADLRTGEWRSRLRPVALQERPLRQLDPGRAPTDEEAGAVLDRAFLDHPFVNVAGRPSGGKVKHDEPPAMRGIVVAEILIQQELAPIPEGGAYPASVAGPLAEPRLIHAAPWTYEQGSAEERSAGDALLAAVIAELPVDLSIPTR